MLCDAELIVPSRVGKSGAAADSEFEWEREGGSLVAVSHGRRQPLMHQKTKLQACR